MFSIVFRKGQNKADLVRNIENYLESKPGDYEIKITKYKEDRSLEQNKFFHGPLMDAFVRATGETDREYMKFALKDKFLRVYLMDEKYYVRETRSLKHDEFQKFIEDCKNYLMDIGGYLTSTEYDSYMGMMGFK